MLYQVHCIRVNLYFFRDGCTGSLAQMYSLVAYLLVVVDRNRDWSGAPGLVGRVVKMSDVRMAKRLTSCEALARVEHQQTGQQICSLVRSLWEDVVDIPLLNVACTHSLPVTQHQCVF